MSPMSSICFSSLRLSVFVCLGLAMLLGQQADEPLLDLTRPDPKPKQAAGPGFGGSVGGSNLRAEDLPFRMTLEGVEPGDYPFRSRLVFEAALVTGISILAIPTRVA